MCVLNKTRLKGVHRCVWLSLTVPVLSLFLRVWKQTCPLLKSLQPWFGLGAKVRPRLQQGSASMCFQGRTSSYGLDSATNILLVYSFQKVLVNPSLFDRVNYCIVLGVLIARYHTNNKGFCSLLWPFTSFCFLCMWKEITGITIQRRDCFCSHQPPPSKNQAPHYSKHLVWEGRCRQRWPPERKTEADVGHEITSCSVSEFSCVYIADYRVSQHNRHSSQRVCSMTTGIKTCSLLSPLVLCCSPCTPAAFWDICWNPFVNLISNLRKPWQILPVIAWWHFTAELHGQRLQMLQMLNSELRMKYEIKKCRWRTL